MLQRFEDLTTGVTKIYKTIQKIKKCKMSSFGLKGTQVMCIYFLTQHPEGLTATDLCGMCLEDKAGMSRILSDLEKEGLIYYDAPQQGKRYRTRILLTDVGKSTASEISALILHAVEAGGQGLDDTEREVFYRTLFQIADNLETAYNEFIQS